MKTSKKFLAVLSIAFSILVFGAVSFVALAPSDASAAWGSGCGLGCGDVWDPWPTWNPEPVWNPWPGIGGGGGGGTPTPVAPSCVSFTASPSSITEGGSATLSWLVSGNPTSISISPTVGTVSTFNGSRVVSPTVTTTYTMTLSNAVGSATCQTTVVVNPPTNPAPTCALTASPTIITDGGSATLSWQVTNASSATLTGFGNLSLPSANASGTKTVAPSSTSSYTLSVLGTNGQTVTCTAGVIVVLPPAPKCTLTADKLVLDSGETTTLRWTISNATEATLQHLDAVSIITPANGTQVTGAVGKYSLSISDNYGRSDVCEVSLTRKPTTPPLECKITVDPTSITKGGSAKITWSSTNATNCVATNFSTNGSLNGMGTVSPDSTTTYSMTCTRPGTGGTGMWEKSYTDVTDLWCPRDLPRGVPPPQSRVYQGVPDCPSNISSSSACSTIGGVCKVNTWNPNTCHVKTQMYSCNSPTGGSTPYTPPTSVTCSAKVIVTEPPAPTCTLSADDDLIPEGGSTTLRWTSSNAVSVTIDKGVGIVALNGAKSVKPLGVTTYRMVAKSATGQEAICTKTVDTYVPVDPVAACTLTADKLILGTGESTTLRWTISNSIEATLQHLDAVSIITPADGTQITGAIGKYTLRVKDAKGRIDTCEVTLTRPTVTPAPKCTLTADKLVLDSGETTTLRWTISNATEATLQHLDAVSIITPANGTQVTGALGTYTLSVGDGTGRTDTCALELKRSVGPGPACTMTINKNSITTGESATLSWTSTNATSGFIDNNVGTTSPVSSGSITIFPPESKTYTGVFTGPLGTTTCSAAIAVNKGPGGCTGNCGGGLNPPNVVLFQKPGDQLLAFVSLSQIPYTGFEAGPVLTFFFWLAVALWSVGLTYLFFGKGGMRFVAERVFAVAYSGNNRYQEYDYPETQSPESQENDVVNYEASEPATTQVNTSVAMAPSVPATFTMPMPSASVAPEPKAPANDGVPELSDVIESRAHAAGILLSPEAVTLATTLSSDRVETLKKFGDVLNEAVKSIPREDGWILLTSDRMSEITQSLSMQVKDTKTVSEGTAPSPTTQRPPTLEVLADSTPSALVRAIFSQDRDTAFALIREYEKEGINPTKLMTGTATTFDSLFCARRDELTTGDLSLNELSQGVSDEVLAKLVEIFTNALDTRYASPYTGVKLAVAQAFDEIG